MSASIQTSQSGARQAEPASAAPGVRRALQLRAGIRLSADGDVTTLTGHGRSTSMRLPAEVRAQFAQLAGPRGVALPSDGSSVPVLWRGLLQRIGHLVQEVWFDGDTAVVIRQPTGRKDQHQAVKVEHSDLLRLDRFAVLRSRDGQLALESPRSAQRYVLLGARARELVASLASPHRAVELLGCGEAALADALLADLVGADLVERADAAGEFVSDIDPVLRQWDYHDLMMHARSRSGRFDEPLGALSPHRGSIEPLPAVVPPRPDAIEVTPLPRPVEPAAGRLTLGEALERRRSIREYDLRPVSLPELGEFLYRSFRCRARFDPPEAGDESKVSRPYPSGGGLYEHELYLTVVRCPGVTAGIHRYDPLHHELQLVNADPAAAQEMLAVAAAATGVPGGPDILLTLTARFQRMSWRYRSIAYANILRTTGAIYQTMYLVATDLDLAPCALGNGDADLAARALGLDYLQESSVGDFLLGRRRASDSVAGKPVPGWTLLDPSPS